MENQNYGKKLRFLFNSTDAIGSMNPLIALAKQLKSRGHEIVFAANISYQQRLEDYGFIYEQTSDRKDANINLDSTQNIANFLMESGVLSAESSIESLRALMHCQEFENYVEQRKNDDEILRHLVGCRKADIIVVNCFCPSPTLVHSGKPWVAVFAESPVAMYNSKALPPSYSGYKTDGKRKDWREYETLNNLNLKINTGLMNEWYTSYGFPKMSHYFPESPYFNIYGFPKELDYTDILPEKENWFRVDDLICKDDDNLYTLPEQLINKPGKLIYLSMGTLGSINVGLMKKFVTILSKSPHRFVVAKGALHSQYELADNMWGEKFLPQTSILPLVDLVITHGGNNSVMETFYFGKPMIVFPIFLDQYDNAQRIHEKQFGIRLNTFEFTENELLDAIETLLNDVDLRDRLEKVSKRIKLSKRLERVAKLIETLVN